MGKPKPKSYHIRQIKRMGQWSYYIVLPKEFLEKLKIKEDDDMKIQVEDDCIVMNKIQV